MSEYPILDGFANKSTFYDKLVYNPLHFKKKRGSKSEVGLELEAITPEADEIRLLGNRNRDCKYYQIGEGLQS